MAQSITEVPEDIIEDNTPTFMHNYAEGFGEMCELAERIKPIKILQAATRDKDIELGITEYPAYNPDYSHPLIEKVIKGQFNRDDCDVRVDTVGECTLYLITPKNADDTEPLWARGESFQYNF